MKHIALLLPDLAAGGAERVMLMLTRAFLANGYKVSVVLIKAEGPLLTEIPANVQIVDLAAKPLGLGAVGTTIHATLALAKWINRSKPDAILSTITGANIVSMLSRLLGAPGRRVLREASSLRNVRSQVRLLLMRLLYPQADALIVMTQVMAEEQVSKILVSPEKIRIIPNPVDYEYIRTRATEPVSHRWLQHKASPLVITVGRLTPAKDHATLIQAFSLLLKTKAANLIILGEGSEREHLNVLIRQLGLENNVELLGYETNPWRWLSRSNVFVLSSRWEGHPNALLEALTLGIPAVVTAYDDSVPAMAQKHDVLVVPPQSPQLLARAICQILERTAPAKFGTRSFLDIGEVARVYLQSLVCDA